MFAVLVGLWDFVKSLFEPQAIFWLLAVGFAYWTAWKNARASRGPRRWYQPTWPWAALLLLCAVVATPLTAQAAHYRHDGAWALPDSVATPGAIETSDTAIVCHRTTKALRRVTAAMHHAIFAAYGIAWTAHAGYEDDHLISLELGGLNDNTNRWPQPYPQAYAKDSVENWAHRKACSGQLGLSYVQRQIVMDWLVLYRQMKGGKS